MSLVIFQSALALLLLTPVACTSQEPGSRATRIQECYTQSVTIEAIFGRSAVLDAENLQQFRERLDGTGVAYTLSTPDPALALPVPSCTACRDKHYDRVMYLIVNRSWQERTLQRFRVYLDGEKPICIEDDFAQKNPYQR